MVLSSKYDIKIITLSWAELICNLSTLEVEVEGS